MSQMGQTRKYSTRAHVFRCSPNNGHRQDTSACPVRAKTGSRLTLLDHLVGERQQGRGHDDAERFRGLEVDDKRKLARLLDGEIAGLGTIQDFRDIDASMTQTVDR